MRKLIISTMLLLLPLAAFSQSPVSAAQQASIINEIAAAAKTVTSIQCDFVQTKTLSLMNDKMVSRGTMTYGQPGRLRWSYTTPYDYTFIISDDKVLIAKGKRQSTIDLKSSQAFQEIARLIAGSVTGQCLTDTRSFDVSILADSRSYVAVLKPKDKRVKKMFASIRLTIDRRSKTMSEVSMNEPSGDATVIQFLNVKQNQPLSAKAFTLD